MTDNENVPEAEPPTEDDARDEARAEIPDDAKPADRGAAGIGKVTPKPHVRE